MKLKLAILSTLILAVYCNTCFAQKLVIDSVEAKTAQEKKQMQRAFLDNFYWWETSISKKPLSWYGSNDGLKMANNILSWQDKGGGWPLMNTADNPFSGDSSQTGPWGMKAALIKATLNEIRFLAYAYHATKDERYLTALNGGLNYILKAQYPSGGWPHSFPYRTTDYSHYATYNDDEIADIMTFLGEVQSSTAFKVIGDEKLKQISSAYQKGIEFILKSQIEVDGQLTAWPQQCDAVSFEPKQARAFEPVAISGSESAGVLLFLMSIRKPTNEVIKAIEQGVQWYRNVQINGVAVIRTTNDVIVKPDLQASSLWARYYEIGSNKPIFAGRDGIVRYQLDEIELERRKGYQWYNQSGTKVFDRYSEWLYERKWDKQPAVNTDESAVGEYTLPNPLQMNNGEMVKSVAQWEQFRRPEILGLFQKYQFGQTPVNEIKTIYEVIEQNVPVMDGLALRTQVRIQFPENSGSPVIRLCLHLPSKTKEPAPTLLHISFTPNILLYTDSGIDEGMAWDVRLKVQIPDKDAFLLKDIDPVFFIEKGYGVATIYYGDIEPDFDHKDKYGIRTMFEASEKRTPDEWGAIGAWSWGLSRVMDYLETNALVDSKRVALSGVSRLGKTVLWAAATDQRFAMVIPILSGEGGAAISRRFYGETIADLTNPFRYHYWYAPNYSEFAFCPEQLPVDGHMLLSLIAPRPLLQIVGSADTWSDPVGEWVAARAVQPVYALYGLTGMEEELPEAEQSIFHHTGFYMHHGKHTVFPRDFEVMANFMDKHFKNE